MRRDDDQSTGTVPLPSSSLVQSVLRLSTDLARLQFGAPVSHVYNPLDYAWEPHRHYLERYASASPEILLIGMNPGPWGMVQTGVPFGEVQMVSTWLGVHGRVDRPASEHPKRPVLGFACRRREASGRRLWGWAEQRFGSAEAFFARFFVWNYCPLCFFSADGANLTPDRLPVAERRELESICDRGLAEVARILSPRFVLGIGRFAERRIAEVLHGTTAVLGGVPHPSPASPAANRGWAEQMEAALRRYGVELA